MYIPPAPRAFLHGQDPTETLGVQICCDAQQASPPNVIAPKETIYVESVRLPTADIGQRGPKVAFVPQADSCSAAKTPVIR
jgi:hypothetical protein